MALTHLQKRTLLRSFSPFNRLDDKALILLDNQIEMCAYEAKDIIFNQGAKSNKVYFFINGSVSAKNIEGDARILHHYDTNVEQIFMHDSTHAYTVVAQTDCVFLEMNQSDYESLCQVIAPSTSNNVVALDVNKIKSKRLESKLKSSIVATENKQSPSAHAPERAGLDESGTEKTQSAHSKRRESEASSHYGDTELKTNTNHSDLLEQINDDILSSQLRLPSIPEVALKIKKAINDPESDIRSIADIVAFDPVIAIKLVEAANSPLYKRAGDVKTILDAVSRLGKDTTQQLVTIFAVRELFNHKAPEILRCLRQIWSDSVEVASINYILAKRSTFNYDPEVALMAGLIARIGEIPILTYSANFPELKDQIAGVERISWLYGKMVGCQIMQQWKMDPVFTHVILHLADWDKANGIQPDYADLTMVSQIIQAEKTPNKRRTQFFTTPVIEDAAVSRSIGFERLTIETTLEILRDVEEELMVVQSMLK
jgi:HD-like signal output (HDOD) protein/CRP-like cAMP-binding protein